MRKILITKGLQDSVNDFSDTLFDGRKFTLPLKALKSLKDEISRSKIIPTSKIKKKVDYVQKIITDYRKILKATPVQMELLCAEFDEIINHKKIEVDKLFYESILTCLNYSELRNTEYLDFAANIGYKCCFYCNAQLAVIVPVEFYKVNIVKSKKNKNKRDIKIGDIKERKATFELDHIKAKSKYPFLSTSFFNLIPSCSICNKAKSKSEINFNYYEDDFSKLDFLDFEIDKASIQEYWKTKKREDLTFTYKTNGYSRDDYNEIFRIQEIYETQKDIIEELLFKQELYTPAYKASIVELLDKKLYSDESMIDRIIIANYAKPEDIHKRPFAKFTQDIARNLKMIK